METDTAVVETGAITSAQELEREIKDAEQRFWQGMKDKDLEACRRLSDFPTIVAGPQGAASIDDKSFAAMLQVANYTTDEFALSDFVIRPLSPDVVVAAYKAHMRLTVDGEAIELDCIESSTWIRRDGDWRCGSHSEAIIGDPFGRDRQRVQ